MKSLKSIYKSVRHSALYYFAKVAFALAGILPRGIGLWLFGMIGMLVFLFPNREKTLTVEHLRFIFGAEWPEKKIRQTAAGVYRSLGKNTFDAIKLARVTDRAFWSIVNHDDFSEVKNAYEEGRGVAVFTAHTGCFEMLRHFFDRQGVKSFTIGRRLFDPRLDNLIHEIRSGRNIAYLDRDGSAMKVLRFLKEGRVFGALIDQDFRAEGVFGTFLGRTAFTVSGPVRVAMKLKIPTFVLTTARLPDNTHRIFICKRLEFVDTGDFEADLVKNVQMANDLICATIMKFPEQWTWMHRRWQQQPEC